VLFFVNFLYIVLSLIKNQSKIKIMGYRINERNLGNTNLEGGSKSRRTAKPKLSNYEKELIKSILMRVYESMEKDITIGKYVDGGRFSLCLSKDQWEALYDIANERKF